MAWQRRDVPARHPPDRENPLRHPNVEGTDSDCCGALAIRGEEDGIDVVRCNDCEGILATDDPIEVPVDE